MPHIAFLFGFYGFAAFSRRPGPNLKSWSTFYYMGGFCMMAYFHSGMIDHHRSFIFPSGLELDPSKRRRIFSLFLRPSILYN